MPANDEIDAPFNTADKASESIAALDSPGDLLQAALGAKGPLARLDAPQRLDCLQRRHGAFGVDHP